MKRLFSACLLALMLTAPLMAQMPEVEKIDYKAIEKEIQDEQSRFYYAKLMERYQNLDETLDLQDFRHLYYGYTFQEGYHPYGDTPWKDSTRTLVKEKDLSEAQLEQLIKFSEQGLKEFPFDLNFLLYLSYAHGKLGSAMLQDQYRRMVKGVMDAILSSGRGKTDKDAIHVICVSDEYLVLDVMGYEFGGSQSLKEIKGESYDYLEVEKNDDKLKGLYFNITRMFGSLSKELGK